MIAVERIALSPRRAAVPPKPPRLASAIDTQRKNLEEAPWLFHGILNHCLNDNVQHEFLLNLSPSYEAT